MRVEARRVRGDDVPLQDLLPTIHHEIELVKKTAGTLDDYRGVAADVLLLYGSNTDSMFKVTAEALQSCAAARHVHRTPRAGPSVGSGLRQTGTNSPTSAGFLSFTLLASSPLIPLRAP